MRVMSQAKVMDGNVFLGNRMAAGSGVSENASFVREGLV